MFLGISLFAGAVLFFYAADTPTPALLFFNLWSVCAMGPLVAAFFIWHSGTAGQLIIGIGLGSTGVLLGFWSRSSLWTLHRHLALSTLWVGVGFAFGGLVVMSA